MKEELNRNDMNRRVAELLGWEIAPPIGLMELRWWWRDGNKVALEGQLAFTTDANQADAAVREAEARGIITKRAFMDELIPLLPIPGDDEVCELIGDTLFEAATADPALKIKALLAAADSLAKVAGGGA